MNTSKFSATEAQEKEEEEEEEDEAEASWPAPSVRGHWQWRKFPLNTDKFNLLRANCH
jgi:hypothetical protein